MTSNWHSGLNSLSWVAVAIKGLNGKENGNYYNGLNRGYIGLCWGYMVPNITPIMENQMDKQFENEMETGA